MRHQGRVALLVLASSGSSAAFSRRRPARVVKRAREGLRSVRPLDAQTGPRDRHKRRGMKHRSSGRGPHLWGVDA
eukprot:1016239-Pyramimonas_sp.AAC.1